MNGDQPQHKKHCREDEQTMHGNNHKQGGGGGAQGERTPMPGATVCVQEEMAFFIIPAPSRNLLVKQAYYYYTMTYSNTSWHTGYSFIILTKQKPNCKNIQRPCSLETKQKLWNNCSEASGKANRPECYPSPDWTWWETLCCLSFRDIAVDYIRLWRSVLGWKLECRIIQRSLRCKSKGLRESIRTSWNRGRQHHWCD